MFKIFLLSLIVMAIIIVAMSVGVLFKRKPIQGSCGGMSALGMKSDCEICGGNPSRCDEVNQQSGSSKTSAKDLSYDATKG